MCRANTVLSIAQNYHPLSVSSSKSLGIVSMATLWVWSASSFAFVCLLFFLLRPFFLFIYCCAFELKYLRRLWDNNFDDTYNLLNCFPKKGATASDHMLFSLFAQIFLCSSHSTEPFVITIAKNFVTTALQWISSFQEVYKVEGE